jgi:hypothetical protein
MRSFVHRLLAFFRPFDWRHAVTGAPGMAACLVYGLVTHDLLTGGIAAGSAFSVGFGLRRKRQVRSMLGAVAVMTAAAVVGSLTGGMFALFVLLAAVSAGVCSALALVDDDVWWVALQACVALFLASHYAGTLEQAVDRGEIVLVGGAFQMACMLLLDRIVPRSHIEQAPKPPAQPWPGSPLSYGLVAAVSVALAMATAYALRLDKAYWAPMVALVVLKPQYNQTRQRGMERLFGTIAGCVAASLLALVQPAGPFDMALAVIGAGCAFAVVTARYAAFSLAVSFTAVMLLSSAHLSAVQSSEQRIYATLIGGVISVAMMWIASRFVRKPAGP